MQKPGKKQDMAFAPTFASHATKKTMFQIWARKICNLKSLYPWAAHEIREFAHVTSFFVYAHATSAHETSAYEKIF